jgi:uncharacterized protein YcbX
MQMPLIAQIFRYPVKGLSAEPMHRTWLDVGETIPFDRAYAIENGPSGFDPGSPQHVPKIAFLMLMRNERLAELQTTFDETTQFLTIRQGEAIVAQGRLDAEAGRRDVERFFDRFEADELRGPTKVLNSPGFSFSDTRGPPKKVLSVINLESVKAIGREIGSDVHPLRFRGNLYVEGLDPWGEFEWVGKRVVAGSVAFEATKRIDRCAAVNVDPLTGKRDLNIVKSMMQAFGHIDCGIYLKVIEPGELEVGMSIAPAAD